MGVSQATIMDSHHGVVCWEYSAFTYPFLIKDADALNRLGCRFRIKNSFGVCLCKIKITGRQCSVRSETHNRPYLVGYSTQLRT